MSKISFEFRIYDDKTTCYLKEEREYASVGSAKRAAGRFAVEFDATVDLAYSEGETSSDEWNDRYVASAFPYPPAESGYAIERITC